MIPRYVPRDFSRLWNSASQYSTWLRVEMAACQSMEALGNIPEGTYKSLEQLNLSEKLDPERIEELEKTTRHDVIAFLAHLEELSGPAGRWIHFGMTSSDVVDTGNALLLHQAADMLFDRQVSFMKALAIQAVKHVNTVMIGRSHGIHAEPTTFGVVLSGHLEEARRNLQRLHVARDSISHGKLSGAVGNYSHGDPRLETHAMSILGLHPEPVATQIVPRDRHSEFFSTLSLLGAGIERFAMNIRHLARTEVGEVQEEFAKGQKGSSAMPHKRNPILCENLCGCARLLRGYSLTASENIPLWHERDISHSSAERVVFADATSLLGYMIDRATSVVNTMVVSPDRMLRNLSSTGKLFSSEGLLLALVKSGAGRQDAYEWVQECAAKSIDLGLDFPSCVQKHHEITSRLDQTTLDNCFDFRHAVRFSEEIVKKAVGDLIT